MMKVKIKTLGRCPKPRKLFEKSLTKNFNLRDNALSRRKGSRG